MEPKRVLPRTKKGSTWNQKGFYLEPKRVLPGTKKGYPMGTAAGPFWNIFL